MTGLPRDDRVFTGGPTSLVSVPCGLAVHQTCHPWPTSCTADPQVALDASRPGFAGVSAPQASPEEHQGQLLTPDWDDATVSVLFAAPAATVTWTPVTLNP